MFHLITLPIIFILALFVIIYFLLRRRKITVPEPEDQGLMPDTSRYFSPFSSSRKVQQEIQSLRAQRKHKMLAHEWESLLLDLGVSKEKAALSHSFYKLKNLVEESRHAGRWKKLTAAEQGALEKLAFIIQQRESRKKPGRLPRKQVRSAIAALKNMLPR